ncbi:NADH-quinone oxidoreductase subunit I 1 [Fibrobacterales bacterium]|nr:NADH-quinone oxidoreductase subunit I 1 [Fibrobacterales bacterium]
MQSYCPEAIRGLFTTLKHFLRGLLRYETLPTIPYPDIKPPIPPNYRGKHRLLKRADGTPRCVACGMCAAACPAKCIRVDAKESQDGLVEKMAARFEIDHLACVFCGLCVEACPVDAIRMDTGITSFVHSSREEFLVNMEELLEGKPATVAN